MEQQGDDFDLTNLNWVAGAEAPMNMSVSPPSSQKKLTPKESRLRDPLCTIVDTCGNKKPMCSYTCLIAVALKAAAVKEMGACLPVHEIYNCIEELFPFFKNVSDGWKNSVRHVLSLSQCFRKTLKDEGWEGKKGYFWEISPDNAEAVHKEVERFLRTEKHSMGDMRAALRAKSQQARVNRTRRRLMATPSREQEQLRDEAPDSSETVIYSPQIQKQLKKCKTPIRPQTEQTHEVFDTNNTPSEFAGIHTPQSDDIGAARELFGCGSTSESNSNCPMYKATNHGEIVPFSTSPMYGMYGLPTVGYGYGTPPTTSPVMGVSPVSPAGYPAPFIPQPIIPFMPVNMYAPYHLPMPMFYPTCQKCGHQNSPMPLHNPVQPSRAPGNSEEDPLSKCDETNEKCTCKVGTKRRKAAATTTPRKRPYVRKTQAAQADKDKDSPSTSVKKPRAKTAKAAQKPAAEEEDDAFVNVESDSGSIEGVSSSVSIRGTRKDGAQSHTNFKGLNEKIQEAAGLTGRGSSQDLRNRPYKALPMLECIKEGAANDSRVEEEGIPALNSLLDLGDASIEVIENAMKLS